MRLDPRTAHALCCCRCSSSRRRETLRDLDPKTRATAMNILTINLLFSTIVFWTAARLYLIPRLPVLEPGSVVVPILLLHAFRHLGLMFLSPGAVFPGMPQQFAYPAAFGDLLAAVLALMAIPAVVSRSRLARPLVGPSMLRELSI